MIRRFLSLLALGAAAFAAPPLRQVAPGVHVLRDTCNVYAVVQDKSALLIDFGSGAILPELKSMGVEKADWILHTHFHRDQCQGDALARAAGVRIAVPAAEQSYFEGADAFWQQKKVFHLYDLRNEFFAPRENIPVDMALKPGVDFEWRGLRLRVIASPGHTEGSLSFLLERDGKRLAFVGDLTGSPGRIRTIHDMEWPYVGARGIAAQIGSLNMMRQHAPDLLLPSHGEPTGDVQAAVPPLITQLATIHDAYNWYTYTVRQPFTSPVRMSPHVWHVRSRQGGTAYVVVSDSGRAFVWDCHANDVPQIEEIRRITGFKKLDFISASHYHDDHVGGINELKKRYGAPFWIMRHMVDVFENPAAYNLPCLWHEPIGVDKALENGERFVWEGMQVQFVYLPGQTEYAQGMLLEVDGKRVLFDGDNIAYPVPGRPMLGHYVARNYQRLDGGHVFSARRFLELRPDFIAPNHFEWVPATEEILRSYLRASEEVNAAFAAVLDQPDPMFGLDANWLSVYPYQVEAKPGDTVRLRVRYRNWLYAQSTIRATFRGPGGWSVEPETVEIRAAPKSESEAAASVRIPATARRDRREVITLEAVRDGDRLGEISEFLVNVAPMKAH